MSDEDLEQWCDWFCDHLNWIAADAGLVVASEVNFSENWLTNVGVAKLLQTLTDLKVNVVVLKLYKNQLASGEELAAYLHKSKGSLHELHLSHNELDAASAAELVLAAASGQSSKGKPMYPWRSIEKGVVCPLWLRLEHNYVDREQLYSTLDAAFRVMGTSREAVLCEASNGMCTSRVCSGKQVPAVQLPYLHLQCEGVPEVSTRVSEKKKPCEEAGQSKALPTLLSSDSGSTQKPAPRVWKVKEKDSLERPAAQSASKEQKQSKAEKQVEKQVAKQSKEKKQVEKQSKEDDRRSSIAHATTDGPKYTRQFLLLVKELQQERRMKRKEERLGSQNDDPDHRLDVKAVPYSTTQRDAEAASASASTKSDSEAGDGAADSLTQLEAAKIADQIHQVAQVGKDTTSTPQVETELAYVSDHVHGFKQQLVQRQQQQQRKEAKLEKKVKLRRAEAEAERSHALSREQYFAISQRHQTACTMLFMQRCRLVEEIEHLEDQIQFADEQLFHLGPRRQREVKQLTAESYQNRARKLVLQQRVAELDQELAATHQEHLMQEVWLAQTRRAQEQHQGAQAAIKKPSERQKKPLPKSQQAPAPKKAQKMNTKKAAPPPLPLPVGAINLTPAMEFQDNALRL
jgi:hypothetical protein